MKRFKKRTIALVIASVVTVVGAFGADNYRNSLMGIVFERSTSDSIKMYIQTKLPYNGNVTPVRKDANTYILMLPEMNNLSQTPNLEETLGNITSVNVRTMPYSNSAKGYTRITIKTLSPSLTLSAQNQIFIPEQQNIQYSTSSKNNSYSQEKQNLDAVTKPKSIKRPVKKVVTKKVLNKEKIDQKTKYNETGELSQNNTMSTETGNDAVSNVNTETNVNRNRNTYSSNDNAMYMYLLAVLIIFTSAYLYIKAKNKMQEIAGESVNIDFRDEKSSHKSKNLKKIKNTINNLDSKYTNLSNNYRANEYTVASTPVKQAKPTEELEIVDLDALFKEQKSNVNMAPEIEDEENDALEDFLSGFSFNEFDAEDTIEEETESFDEELYQKTIQNDSLSFTNNDIECLNQLLNTEINDETLRNIEQYAVSNPIKKQPTKKQLLENIATDYAISQNIIFTSKDMEILYKLISVELDQDFITDLRTNPERTLEMAQEIQSFGDKAKKPSEIVTMSVKDLLPDLSEALKKQGGKKIESEYKAETVYFSEGYDVKTLSIGNELPDLAVEINNKDAYVSKPSAGFEIVDTNYTVGSVELKTNSVLPDLSDVLANPDKYNEPEKEEAVVDAEALLNSITDVQFKPFDDGTRNFEVLNDFEDTPSVEEIQNEFSQFGDFEIAQEENYEVSVSSEQNDYNDFEALYDDSYYDLDGMEEDDGILNEIAVAEPPKEISLDTPTIQPPTRVVEEASKPQIIESKSLANDLLEKIQRTKQEREERKSKILENKINKINEKNEQPQQKEQKVQNKYVIDNEALTIISSVNFTDNLGCHLAKGADGYVILGYVGEKLFKIKNYEMLKSEKLQTRMSEKLENGSSRYIVRIGLHKFIVNVNGDNIEYVMDLC
ncbi:hypothetical protein IJ384_06905 [bacterium]|nr:hypothetical protein [bacterium]